MYISYIFQKNIYIFHFDLEWKALKNCQVV